MPKVIGVCGTTGSGKSSLCDVIANMATIKTIMHLEADKLAHKCYAPGTSLYEQLISEFGGSIVDKEHAAIDRKRLGRIVFEDSEALTKLNALVWPAIQQAIIDVCNTTRADIILLDAALLLEAGWHTMCTEIWYINCSKEECIARCKKRNPGSYFEQIDTIYTSQSSLEKAKEILASNKKISQQKLLIVDNNGRPPESNVELVASLIQRACE